jgi:hypothetical protein
MEQNGQEQQEALQEASSGSLNSDGAATLLVAIARSGQLEASNGELDELLLLILQHAALLWQPHSCLYIKPHRQRRSLL